MVLTRSALLAVIALGCGGGAASPARDATGGKCVDDGANIQRMTSGSFGPDYQGCHVQIPARFMAVMSVRIPSCGDGTVFAVLNATDNSKGPAMVCVPKAQASILFDLKHGDPIAIVGGSWDMLGTGAGWGLRADSIERRL